MRRSKRFLNLSTFTLINTAFMILIIVIMLYPLLNVLAVSLSSHTSYVRNKAMIFPTEIDLSSYKKIFSSSSAIEAMGNSIFVASVGTLCNMIVTVFLAFPLSKRRIRASGILMKFIVFTMLFSGGMIPTYLVVKSTGLIDSLWALIFPVLVSTYNLLVIKNFFESIPDSLEESFAIDGAGPMRTLINLYIPLSIPSLAVITMFYCVSHWNSFFNAMLYINSKNKWTIMLFLREIITENTDVTGVMDPMGTTIYPKTMQCTTIVVTILPILFVYPFVQRYFVKGVMIGAVKE